jgi:hypothetical protein
VILCPPYESVVSLNPIYTGTPKFNQQHDLAAAVLFHLPSHLAFIFYLILAEDNSFAHPITPRA